MSKLHLIPCTLIDRHYTFIDKLLPDECFRPRMVFPGWAWPTLIFCRVGGCPLCPQAVSSPCMFCSALDASHSATAKQSAWSVLGHRTLSADCIRIQSIRSSLKPIGLFVWFVLCEIYTMREQQGADVAIGPLTDEAMCPAYSQCCPIRESNLIHSFPKAIRIDPFWTIRWAVAHIPRCRVRHFVPKWTRLFVKKTTEG